MPKTKIKINSENVVKTNNIIFILLIIFLFSFFLFQKSQAQTAMTLTLYQIPGSTTVTYNSTGATACGFSTPSNPPNGWFDLHPTISTTYHFTCWNGINKITKSIFIRVGDGIISDVLTGRAEPVRATKAKLWGSLNPGGVGGPQSAKVYFRYSSVSPQQVTPIFCNDIYGSNMRGSKESFVWGDTPQEVNIEIGNLSPNTTYYYCLVGSTNKEIVYGGVKSFTTWPESSVTIETKKPLVASETSAFLNGFYNSNVKTETWFEYRQYSQDRKTFSEWKQVGKETHEPETNGKISYELKGLSSGEKYQYKAVAKDISNNNVIYGIPEAFNTKGNSGSGNGTTPGGVGYQDPCSQTDNVNCNGTGGNSGISFGGGGLPDLTVGEISPTNIIVNKTTPLIATVRNIGGTSTGSSFFGFFQISTVYRGPVNEINSTNKTSPTGNNTSFLEKILNIKKANAANTGTGTMSADITLFNLPAISIPEIMGRNSAQIQNNYNFVKLGDYYIRACADKKSVSDTGLIKEMYENNNCGPWTKIVVSIDGNNNTGGGIIINNNGNNNYQSNNYENLSLGQNATPPVDAIVRYHEGIEHVFVRQIKNNIELAESYGYNENMNMETFAWDLADLLARTFGYVNSSGKEIRVSKPDIAAYQLYMSDGILTVYEYYNGVIVNIQKITNILRSKYEYEYYFNKR